MSQNGISRRDFLKGVVAGAVSAATVGVLQGCQNQASAPAAVPETTAPAAPAGLYTPGTYTASAQGCLSEVGVTVTITGGKVTNVVIDASGETPELGGKAAETLSASLLAAGSTVGVDAVSGSTMTSDAVFAAINDCLAQAAQ